MPPMGGIRRRVKSLFDKGIVGSSNEDNTKFQCMVRNGGVLLEKILSLSNGRRDISTRTFTAEEIILATNNFQECVMTKGDFIMFKGNVDDRSVLIYKPLLDIRNYEAFILGIAINGLMSHLKYILKLIGCCMEFEFPALVFEHAGTTNLSEFRVAHKSLSWNGRIKMARDIASMIVYFHTSFSLEIIHRNLHPFNVIIDQNGDAKLFNFTLAIAIPEGDSKVVDVPMGTFGFIDPEYLSSGFVSTKSDVYAFGLMFLEILTGESFRFGKHRLSIDQYVKHICTEMLHDIGKAEFEAVIDIILSCVKENGEDRPEMIHVATRLHMILKNLPMNGQV